MLQELIQQLLNGIIAGSTYALIGLGLTLVYGVMELVNFAHGEFAMIGGFTTYFLVAQYKQNYLLAIAAGFVAAAAVGILVDLLAFYPLRRTNPLSLMLSSLGVSIFLVNLAQYFFTPDPQRVDTPFTEKVYRFGGLAMTQQRLLVLVTALALAAGTYFLIQRTRFGRALRAASLDAETALLYGVDTDRVAFLTFALGTGLAGVTGALLGPIFYVYPTMGIPSTLKAFVVVVLGGMGSVPGAITGGLIVGLVESFGAGLISSAYKDVIVYLVLILVLILKPHGLFRRYREEKV